MSEKAACPRCDAYVSEIYYDGRHRWCGWNCRVEYKLSAHGPTGHASLTVRSKPTDEQRTAIAAIAALVGAERVDVSVAVDGESVDRERMSPWVDPDQADPRPLSKRKQAENLKALRDRRVENATHAIDEEFGL